MEYLLRSSFLNTVYIPLGWQALWFCKFS